MLLARLADAVDRLHPGRRVLVAVDGPDAAGKTTLATALAQQVRRPVVQACVDDWQHPRAVRYARGSASPEGYWLDAFDHRALATVLLQPFRDGAAAVRTAPQAPLHAVPPDAALVVDGVFLLRHELRDRWDLSVHLHVPEDVTLGRAGIRDLPLWGTAERVRQRYEQRYLPGQRLYAQEARPQQHADVVVDNSDPAAPVVRAWRLPSG